MRLLQLRACINRCLKHSLEGALRCGKLLAARSGFHHKEYVRDIGATRERCPRVAGVASDAECLQKRAHGSKGMIMVACHLSLRMTTHVVCIQPQQSIATRLRADVTRSDARQHAVDVVPVLSAGDVLCALHSAGAAIAGKHCDAAAGDPFAICGQEGLCGGLHVDPVLVLVPQVHGIVTRHSA